MSLLPISRPKARHLEAARKKWHGLMGQWRDAARAAA